jgi:hypothetical protein
LQAVLHFLQAGHGPCLRPRKRDETGHRGCWFPLLRKTLTCALFATRSVCRPGQAMSYTFVTLFPCLVMSMHASIESIHCHFSELKMYHKASHLNPHS